MTTSVVVVVVDFLLFSDGPRAAAAAGLKMHLDVSD